MYPHQIRLRGPWECEPLPPASERATALLPPRRVTMPCSWSATGLSDFEGHVRFRRFFGYPGRIDEYERVWLILTGIDPRAQIHLNHHRLGQPRISDTTLEFEVTQLLQARNELAIEIEAGAGPDEPWRDVALEVRCQAFLCDLRRIAILTEEGVGLRVSGQVVGEADRPLELYVLVDGSVVSYQVIAATPAGNAFAILVSDSSPEKWRASDNRLIARTVRVDLVNAATIWYSSSEQVTPSPDFSRT